MVGRIHAALAAAALGGFFAPAAQAANCAPYATVRDNLAEQFHEVPIARAISTDRKLAVVFASNGGATWTLVEVAADDKRTTCVRAAGRDWMPNWRALGVGL